MNDRRLDVHPLPQLVAESALAGGTTVVIDLLRATSTICQAIASRAVEVVPFLEIDDARKAVESVADRKQVLLGGEREGRRIEGFDLGNSPAEYRPEVVAGRRVFLTTTNGTRALYHARLAQRVLVGALVNLSAVVAALCKEPRIDILCAGTGGEVTREDLLAAGAIVEGVTAKNDVEWQLNEAAKMACRDWQEVVAAARASGRSLSEYLATELRDTPGGRNLLSIDMDRDLAACARIGAVDVLPELDVREWRIRKA